MAEAPFRALNMAYGCRISLHFGLQRESQEDQAFVDK